MLSLKSECSPNGEPIPGYTYRESSYSFQRHPSLEFETTIFSNI